MEKKHNNQSCEPATTADLRAMKTEIIEAVKDTMTEMMEELTATHEDVRHVRTTVTMLVNSDAAQDAAITDLTARVTRLQKEVGLVN